MCLEPEWFDDSTRRNFMRDIEGVTPEEATEALSWNYSTIYPVATEMAKWLNKNWSKRDIAIKLGDENLALIESICDDNSPKFREHNTQLLR